MKIGFDLDSDTFEQDMNIIYKNVLVEGKEGVKESGKILEINTTPFVPLREGLLERGFSDKLLIETDLIELEVQYNAKSPTGYDYAPIQHESTHFKHPIRGTSHYLNAGFVASDGEIITMISEKIQKAMQ